MTKIVLHRRAQKFLERLDARIKAQLVGKLESLAQDPESAPGVKPMEGDYAGYFRLRHGDVRVIYQWDKEQDIIVISHLGHRGDIY